MRARWILLVLAVTAAAVVTLLNWAEFSRPSPLNLVWRTVDAPLALVLLGLLALTVVVSLASGIALRARQRRHEHDHAQALKTQRDLADRAEASRFIDLRQALDAHVRESRDRERGLSNALEQVLQRQHRETRTQLEGLHRALGTRLGEMEARLEQRLESALRNAEWPSSPASGQTRETGRTATWAEPASAVRYEGEEEAEAAQPVRQDHSSGPGHRP